MVTFFITLALLLVCLVALGALVKTDPRGGVSSFEHLVEGSIGIACVLYGLVLLYGVTGSTNLSFVVGSVRTAPGVVALSIALVLLGLCATSASSRCASGSDGSAAMSRPEPPASSSR